MEDIQKSYHHEQIKRTVEVIKTLRISMLVMDFEEFVDEFEHKSDVAVVLKTVDQFLDILHKHMHPLNNWLNEIHAIFNDPDLLLALSKNCELATTLKKINKYYKKAEKNMLLQYQNPLQKKHPFEKLFKQEIKQLMTSLKSIESMVRVFEYYYSEILEDDEISDAVIHTLSALMAVTSFHSLSSEMYDFMGDMQELYGAPKLLKALKKSEDFWDLYQWIGEESEEMKDGVIEITDLTTPVDVLDEMSQKNHPRPPLKRKESNLLTLPIR